MATKCVCDECGAEGAGRVTLELARSVPLKLPANMPWRIDCDLCQEHFDKLVAKAQDLFKKGALAT